MRGSEWLRHLPTVKEGFHQRHSAVKQPAVEQSSRAVGNKCTVDDPGPFAAMSWLLQFLALVLEVVADFMWFLRCPWQSVVWARSRKQVSVIYRNRDAVPEDLVVDVVVMEKWLR